MLGRFSRWRHARPLLQAPLLIVSVVMILHGLFGPSLAPKNLATTLSWLHFRGVLVLVLLCAGNFFCLACPFMLVRQLARRFFRPRFNWPRPLRNKWLSVGLFVLILFALRAVRSVVFAVVDGLADRGLLRRRAGGRWLVQARFVLQVCLSHRAVQLRGLDAFAARSEGARSGCLHDVPDQGLHSRPARAGSDLVVINAAANWRCFSRARSATWIALSVWTASTPARTTMLAF